MSLDANKLYREFLVWFKTGNIYTYAQAERRLAKVYHDYAQGAEDVSGEGPDNLDASRFERHLRFSGSRTARQFAQQVDDAFVAYWTGTTFSILVLPPASPPCPNVGGTGEFSVELSSQVTAVAAGRMRDAILPVVDRATNTAEQVARRLADVMDSVTRSAVTVVITGQDTGSPSPSPIYNECGVF